ncbi:MAG: hypothetical protein ACYTX0_33890, partial [Nostoc sp.]
FEVSPSQEQPLSQNWERGANSLVPRIPTWEKGLGDEGKTLQWQYTRLLSCLLVSTSVPLGRGCKGNPIF